MLRSTISRPTVMTTDVTLQHTSTLCPSLLLSLLHCKAIYLESLRRKIMSCVPGRVFHERKDNVKIRGRFFCFALFLFINVKYTKYPGSSNIPGTRLKSTRVRVLEHSFQPNYPRIFM